MEEKLKSPLGKKPCPFCGSKNTVVLALEEFNPKSEHYVVCKFCRAMGPNSASKLDAIMWWNNRRPLFGKPDKKSI